jgi:hypothetical protein
VHIPFFNKVVCRKGVSKEEEVKVVGDFKEFTTDVLKDLSSKLSSVKSGLGDDPGPMEWIRLLELFFAPRRPLRSIAVKKGMWLSPKTGEN